jgi:hypothetical protein
VYDLAMFDVHQTLNNLEDEGLQLCLEVEALVPTLLEVIVQILPQELEDEAIMIPEKEVVDVIHYVLLVELKTFITHCVP